MARPTRPISWIKAAQKDFEAFPDEVRLRALQALTIAAEGSKADIAKPLQGFGSGVFEIAFHGEETPTAWCMPYSWEQISGCSMRFRKSRKQG